jgi:ABC-type glycerol-3-phosphate transport system substrate-binding protein
VRFGTVLAALLVIATFLASEWVVTPKHDDGKVHITYWEKWTGFEFEAVKKVVDEYNRSQSKVHVDLLSVSGIHNKTLMATAAGVPPDVAGLFGPNVAQYFHDRAVIPLDEMCAEAGIAREDYIPIYWDICTFEGRLYALPLTPASTALHYNTRLFAQAGLTRPPETIEEMDAYVAKLTKRNADKQITIAGFVHQEPGWWNWGWGFVFGGELWDGESRITCDSPENVRAFTWVQSYVKKYGKSQLQNFRSGFGAFNSPQNAFMSEKVAMVLQGGWMGNFIANNNPDLPWAAAPFPYPADRPDLKGRTFADLDILVIPRGAKHPKEAFEFITYMQSQKAMEALCLGQTKHSPLAKSSPEFYANHPNPYIHLFTDMPKNDSVVSPPKIAIWPEYASELRNAFDEVVLNGADPRAALTKVRQRMQPALDRYLREKKLREGQ